MRRVRYVNEMDVLGAGAVLVAYLSWAVYQVGRQGRNPVEVHLALTLALIVGLAYRLLWQGIPPRASTALQRPAYLRSWQPNPYEYLFGSLALFALSMVAVWILIAPTAGTPLAQLGQRLMVGFGLALLLITLFWSARECRKGFGQSHPPDAGIRSPLSPVPSASAGNAQKLPEEENLSSRAQE